MSHHRPTNSPTEEERSQDPVEGLLKCVLTHFSQISEARIHKLAFMIEYQVSQAGGKRETDAKYYRVADGCRSDDISNALDDMESVEQKSVQIGNEEINTIVRQSEMSCELGVEDTAENIITEYGDKSPEIVNEWFTSVAAYRDANLGEEIRF